ncbi:unnamed protein product [Clonostachys byssicola]|uniref:Oxidase ustYa n=1 Tax=Clonostachys byssicola TaxID=160290 RepID=A0A9N9Y799_9HYPO|nr:unnamed protein product [Clonostachys byssicola]
MPFQYNRTFGQNPFRNNATVEAWEAILPLGQGSVQFPPKSSQVHTLSVAHQLHCLWSIHQAFYIMEEARDASPGPQAGVPDGEGPDIFSHVRHCFDYLRQSLICAGDTTLEPVDPKLGGVTGWGNLRVCRDFDEIKAWAEGHRMSNYRGFLKTAGSHHHAAMNGGGKVGSG